MRTSKFTKFLSPLENAANVVVISSVSAEAAYYAVDVSAEAAYYAVDVSAEAAYYAVDVSAKAAYYARFS